MLKPKAIKPGDRVAVLAPASPFDREGFDRGIDELRSIGFDPVFDNSVFSRRGYLAGSPEHRSVALRAAWRDPEIRAIFAVRGGYGSSQLLPLLDVSEVRDDPKPFIGCSDLTALLIYLTTNCGTVGFHGPMLVNLADHGAGYDRSSLLECVTSPTPLGELRPDGVESLCNGEASGTLLGGTLTQLLASLSTPFAFDPPAGYVLFLDDVGEKPYRIDRMLTQVRQAGLLKAASAVVFAEFPGCSSENGPDVKSVVSELLEGFPGPVLFGFPSGHTNGPTLTLPFGVTARVTSGLRPGLIVDEAAVE
jgi:muramoyltetrapeptide carboxypeptidase